MKLLAVVLGLAVQVVAQHGSAPSGFYPHNYHGDTFTGQVVQTTDKSITLEYHNGKNDENFIGSIDQPCMAPTKKNPREQKELHLTVIPPGSVVTVFYNEEKRKQADGSQKRENIILAIRFDEVNGQKLTNPGRPVTPCAKATAGLAVY